MIKRNTTQHAINPYQTRVNSQHATIYAPDEYRLTQMGSSLTAIALRVLLYALAKLKPDGSVTIEPMPVARRFQTTSQYVSNGVRELIKANILQRRTKYDFWLNPDLAKPILIQTG